jgi:hypothetical protein
MSLLKVFVVAVFILTLGACASTKTLNLENLRSNKITTISLKASEHVRLDIIHGYGATDLIAFVAAEAAAEMRKQKDQKYFKPIRSNLLEFYFKQEISDLLVEMLPPSTFHAESAIKYVGIEGALREGLNIHGHFQLSEDLAELDLKLDIVLVQDSKKVSKRSYKVKSRFAEVDETINHVFERLIANQSSILKTQIRFSIREALSMLNKDFSGIYVYKKHARGVYHSPTNQHFAKFVRVIDEYDDRVVLGYKSLGRQVFYSIPEALTRKSPHTN